MEEAKNIFNISLLLIFLLWILLPISFQLMAQDVITLEESACQLLDKGEIEKAVELLQKELKANPDNLNVQLYLGIALYMKKDLEGAFEKFEKIEKETDRRVDFDRPPGFERPEEVDPKLIEAWIDKKGKGRVLFSKERKGLLYFYRGLTLKEKKNWKDAEKRFKEALKDNYDEQATRLQLFDLYIKKQDIKSALEELNDLKKASGESEVFIFLDGYLKYREGNLEQALAAFEKLAPTDPAAKKNVALLYYNRGDYAKAIELWEEIISEDPEDREAQISIGRAAFHLGDSEKAQDYFTRAGIKIPPEKFSPKKIPLTYESILKALRYNLMCKVK